MNEQLTDITEDELIQLKPEDIVLIRFHNKKHDILGFLLNQTKKKIIVGKPFSVYMKEGMLIPYCVFSDESIYSFPNKKIEFIVSTSDAIKQEYLNLISGDREITQNNPETVH